MLIRNSRTGAIGELARKDDGGDTYIVVIDGHERRWSRFSAKPVHEAKLPRGMLLRPITLFETECTQLRAKGFLYKDIAAKLGCTKNAAQVAVTNVEAIRQTMTLMGGGQ